MDTNQKALAQNYTKRGSGMEKQKPQRGELYQHFKGNLYEIVTLATHTESMEEMVVYQDHDQPEKIYVRPLNMFFDPVDTEKYPDAKQTLRFELYQETGEPVLKQQDLLMEFLDLTTAKDRILFLETHRDSLTEEFLGIAAVSLDFTENAHGFEERYLALLGYLRMVAKYEIRR